MMTKHKFVAIKDPATRLIKPVEATAFLADACFEGKTFDTHENCLSAIVQDEVFEFMRPDGKIALMSINDIREQFIHVASEEDDVAYFSSRLNEACGPNPTHYIVIENRDIFISRINGGYFLINECGQRSLWRVDFTLSGDSNTRLEKIQSIATAILSHQLGHIELPPATLACKLSIDFTRRSVPEYSGYSWDEKKASIEGFLSVLADSLIDYVFVEMQFERVFVVATDEDTGNHFPFEVSRIFKIHFKGKFYETFEECQMAIFKHPLDDYFTS